MSSTTFGAWHLVDGFEAAGVGWPIVGSVAFAAGVAVVTGLAGAFLFAPLRPRTGAVYPPALLHAARSRSGTLLTGR